MTIPGDELQFMLFWKGCGIRLAEVFRTDKSGGIQVAAQEKVVGAAACRQH